MTIWNKLLLPFQLLISMMILSFMSIAYAQSVVSLSSEVLKDIAADELYWQVGVTCSGVEEPRLMQQRAGEVGWCAVEIPQLCSESKDTVAEQLCGEAYELLTASDSSASEPEEVPQPEAVQIAREPDPEPVVSAPIAPAPVVQQEIVTPTQIVAPVQEPIAIIQSEPIESISEPIVDAPSNTTRDLFEDTDLPMSPEEIAIEEELIRIEEEMLTIRLQEIELEQQATQNSDE